MTLNFPTNPDLPLDNPPLKEVIFQLRFTPLLEIVQNLPATFHSHIRKDFPGFEENKTVSVDLNQSLPSEYVFKSSSEKSKVALGINYVSFSTQEYTHWHAFEGTVRTSLETLKKSYGTIFVSRIGLRYINELNSRNTGFSTIEEILTVLNADLTHLAFTNTWNLPKRAIHQLSLEDNTYELTIRLAFEKMPKPVVLLDFDYFILNGVPEELDINETMKKLDDFHKNCYNAFRWCIREEHLQVFGPKKG